MINSILLELIQKSGESKLEIARKTNINRNQLDRWCNGDVIPNTTLTELLLYLSKNPEELWLNTHAVLEAKNHDKYKNKKSQAEIMEENIFKIITTKRMWEKKFDDSTYAYALRVMLNVLLNVGKIRKTVTHKEVIKLWEAESPRQYILDLFSKNLKRNPAFREYYLSLSGKESPIENLFNYIYNHDFETGIDDLNSWITIGLLITNKDILKELIGD